MAWLFGWTRRSHAATTMFQMAREEPAGEHVEEQDETPGEIGWIGVGVDADGRVRHGVVAGSVGRRGCLVTGGTDRAEDLLHREPLRHGLISGEVGREDVARDQVSL